MQNSSDIHCLQLYFLYRTFV